MDETRQAELTDGLRGQVTLEGLVDRDTVHVGVVDEPDDLVREELRVVLAVQVRLRGLRGVQLKTLPDAFTEDVARRVRLHDLCHGLLDERLQAGYGQGPCRS